MGDDGRVPTLTDLVRDHTDLTDTDLEWLHALVSDWQLLADLSFADLLLWVPLRSADTLPADGTSRPGRGKRPALDTGEVVPGWVAIAQMRPTTGPTAYPEDLVGKVVRTERRKLIDVAWRERRIVREGDPEWGSGIPVREESIPVRRGAKVLGVIQRSTNLSSARTPSRLELTYLQSASDLATMISEGRFPVPGEEPNLVRSPRVGDGLMRLDRAGKVTYASPNAQSAYRRLGFPRTWSARRSGRSPPTCATPASRWRRRSASCCPAGRRARWRSSRAGRSCSCGRSRWSSAGRGSARWCCAGTSPSCGGGTGS